MFGKDKEIKKSDETLLLKELLKIGQTIGEFKTEVNKSIWHLERKVESIQIKLNIDPQGNYERR